jgi:hypothetical protein
MLNGLDVVRDEYPDPDPPSRQGQRCKTPTAIDRLPMTSSCAFSVVTYFICLSSSLGVELAADHAHEADTFAGSTTKVVRESQRATGED